MKYHLILLASLVLAGGAVAVEYRKLAGSYSFSGANFYDPPAGEAQDTHIFLEIDGQAAKDLFAKMKVKPLLAECGDPGTQTKRIKDMQCTRSANAKEYRCWFGIDIANQKIVNGVVC